jgi:hypothetical protein
MTTTRDARNARRRFRYAEKRRQQLEAGNDELGQRIVGQDGSDAIAGAFFWLAVMFAIGFVAWKLNLFGAVDPSNVCGRACGN